MKPVCSGGFGVGGGFIPPRTAGEGALKQVKDGGFFGAQLAVGVGERGGFAAEGLGEGAVEVGVENRGVDVALAADGFGVAEALGDGLDGAGDIVPGLFLGGEAL